MIGNSELIIIFIVTLLLFGPEKVPELARSLGKAVAEFKKASREVEREVVGEIKEDYLSLKEMDKSFVEELKSKEEL